MIPNSKREERLSPQQSHGVKALKRAVKTLGSRTIDQRTRVGKVLAGYRADLIADLGGIESLSKQEFSIVEEVVITALLLSGVNARLLTQPTLINKRQRSVIAAVQQRNALVTRAQRHRPPRLPQRGNAAALNRRRLEERLQESRSTGNALP